MLKHIFKDSTSCKGKNGAQKYLTKKKKDLSFKSNLCCSNSALVNSQFTGINAVRNNTVGSLQWEDNCLKLVFSSISLKFLSWSKHGHQELWGASQTLGALLTETNMGFIPQSPVALAMPTSIRKRRLQLLHHQRLRDPQWVCKWCPAFITTHKQLTGPLSAADSASSYHWLSTRRETQALQICSTSEAWVKSPWSSEIQIPKWREAR